MRCPACKKPTLKLVFSPLPEDCKYTCLCKECLNQTQSPKSAVIHNCDSFTSHYDSQLGQYFTSKEEKTSYLKSQNLTQVSGTTTPKSKEGLARLPMTKDQYNRAKRQGKL